jgi:hypothetical protein
VTWWRSRRSKHDGNNGTTTANQSTDMYIITSPIHQLFVSVFFFPFTRRSKCPRLTRNWKSRRNRFLEKIRQLLSSYCRCRGHTGQSAVCCVKTVSHAESNLLKVGGTDRPPSRPAGSRENCCRRLGPLVGPTRSRNKKKRERPGRHCLLNAS